MWPKRHKRSILEILKKIPSLSYIPEYLADQEYWRDSCEGVDVGPKSLYTFLTPLACILFGATTTHFTPTRVKWRCLNYADLPDVQAFHKDLLAHIFSVLHWNPPD